jgi:transglutaminase-like putative cysteine protease
MQMQPEDQEFNGYLEDTIVIDWQSPAVMAKSRELVADCRSEEERVRALYEWVRDEIPHSYDIDTDVVTCRASSVLKEGTGLCFAKSHLLAALLRASGIPAGFGYQRLRQDPPAEGHVLHGFVCAYLSERRRWVVLDARGNNRQVHAEFEIDEPSFAYRPDAEQGEKTIEVIFTRPNQTVVDMLERSRSLKKVRNHLPGEL